MRQRLWFFLWLLTFPCAARSLEANSDGFLKPYRVLLVVDNWKDPSSQVVTNADSFQPVAALLKAWSIPFDILRLDQQTVTSGYLFERDGRIRYGVVLWLSDLPSYAGKNIEILGEAVQAGASLVAVCSRVRDPILSVALGVNYRSDFRSDAPLTLPGDHFITRGSPRFSEEYGSHIWVETAKARDVIRQGLHPALTVNEPFRETAGLWIGAPSVRAIRDSPYWRTLFQRSLTWAFGYLLLPDFDYSRQILVMIDDWGTSDKSYLSYWNYQTVPESLMQEAVIPVLKKHHVTASANVITGFVDRKTHRVLSPWQQSFTDDKGRLQDYGSTRRGLLDAVAAGVFEIESHGWTHMQDDLDAPPGPWWNANLDGEASVGGWYEEFEDSRRGAESPALTQLYHLQRSLEYLKQDFDAQPLSVIIGGGGWSKSYPNQSVNVAARAGFGLFDVNEYYYYLDHTLALDMTGISPGTTHQYDRQLNPHNWPEHPDGPYVLLFHDRDISLQHDFVERTFNAVPSDAEFISMNQYIGVLHAALVVAPNAFTFQFSYDDHYCLYFKSHPSSWKLILSDGLVEKLRVNSKRNVVVDGHVQAKLSEADLDRHLILIHLPAGIGTHSVSLPVE